MARCASTFRVRPLLHPALQSCDEHTCLTAYLNCGVLPCIAIACLPPARVMGVCPSGGRWVETLGLAGPVEAGESRDVRYRACADGQELTLTGTTAATLQLGKLL